MKIEKLEEKELRVSLSHEGKLDFSVLDTMKSLECILPFQYLAEEENSIRYYIGDSISIIEYLNMKELSFDEARDIFLACADSFLRIEKCGGICGNVIDNLYYVFINPVTRDLRLLYCPVEVELCPEAFRNVMRDLVFAMRTKDAEMLLGTVVEKLSDFSREENTIETFINAIQTVKENVKIIEKKVEVDRIMEKVIEKQVEKEHNTGREIAIFSLIYFLSMIVLPFGFAQFMDSALVAAPALLNILICLCAIFIRAAWVMKKGKRKDKMIVTTQPEKK